MRISDWSSDVCSSDLLELARNQILWLRTVVFIGEIGRRHRNRIAELSGRLVETEQHIGTLDDAYRRLAEAKTRLEMRVAGQMKTVVSPYPEARAIDRQIGRPSVREGEGQSV